MQVRHARLLCVSVIQANSVKHLHHSHCLRVQWQLLLSCCKSYTVKVSRVYLVIDIICKYDLLAFLDLLRVILVTDSLHAAWIACRQAWLVIVPAAIVLVLHAERLDLKANNSGQVSVGIPVVQNGEAKMIMQGKCSIILHTKNASLAMSQTFPLTQLQTPDDHRQKD